MKAAQDGANIVIAAKTAEPHPKLPGTIYTAAKEGKFIGANKNLFVIPFWEIAVRFYRFK